MTAGEVDFASAVRTFRCARQALKVSGDPLADEIERAIGQIEPLGLLLKREDLARLAKLAECRRCGCTRRGAP